MVEVTQLAFYPVKGCAAVYVPSLEISATGPRHDRSFMVVDGNGLARTQRGNPRLATIVPEIDYSGAQLTLRAPEMPDLAVAVRADGPQRDVEMFAAPYRAVDQGDEAARWVSDVLGASSRLVRVPPDQHRVVDGFISGSAGFADSAALTLLSETSLAMLNDKIRANGREPVPMDRFRGNVIVDGWAEPNVEDRIREASIGDTALGFLKLDIRCAVTMVDQQLGRRAGAEPLATLAQYRRADVGGVAFGIKLSVVGAGTIAVGDAVEVSAWESVGG